MAEKVKKGTVKTSGKSTVGTAEKTVKIAFIGYGIQGRTVLVPNIIKQKNVVVKAVCDCDRVRREAGAKYVNDYYKKNVQKVGKKKNTKTNSPLFVCVFKCIITSFKYFNKYVNVLEQMPHRITDSVTKNEIDCLWIQFLALPENKELLELYDNNYDNKDESKEDLITLEPINKDIDEKQNTNKQNVKHSKSKICLDDDLNDIL